MGATVDRELTMAIKKARMDIAKQKKEIQKLHQQLEKGCLDKVGALQDQANELATWGEEVKAKLKSHHVRMEKNEETLSQLRKAR